MILEQRDTWLWHSKVAHFGILFWPTLGLADF
jgi:hypothetical protein